MLHNYDPKNVEDPRRREAFPSDDNTQSTTQVGELYARIERLEQALREAREFITVIAATQDSYEIRQRARELMKRAALNDEEKQ